MESLTEEEIKTIYILTYNLSISYIEKSNTTYALDIIGGIWLCDMENIDFMQRQKEALSLDSITIEEAKKELIQFPTSCFKFFRYMKLFSDRMISQAYKKKNINELLNEERIALQYICWNHMMDNFVYCY